MVHRNRQASIRPRLVSPFPAVRYHATRILRQLRGAAAATGGYLSRAATRRSVVVLAGLVAGVALLFAISKVVDLDVAAVVEAVGVVVALLELLRRVAAPPAGGAHDRRRPQRTG